MWISLQDSHKEHFQWTSSAIKWWTSCVWKSQHPCKAPVKKLKWTCSLFIQFIKIYYIFVWNHTTQAMRFHFSSNLKSRLLEVLTLSICALWICLNNIKFSYSNISLWNFIGWGKLAGRKNVRHSSTTCLPSWKWLRGRQFQSNNFLYLTMNKNMKTYF